MTTDDEARGIYETVVHHVDSDVVVQTLGDISVGVDESGAWMLVNVLNEAAITVHLPSDQLRRIADWLNKAAYLVDERDEATEEPTA